MDEVSGVVEGRRRGLRVGARLFCIEFSPLDSAEGIVPDIYLTLQEESFWG